MLQKIEEVHPPFFTLFVTVETTPDNQTRSELNVDFFFYFNGGVYQMLITAVEIFCERFVTLLYLQVIGVGQI